MRFNPSVYGAILLLIIFCQPIYAQSADQNIITYDNIESTVGWSGSTLEAFDESESHKIDGSGSFKMSNAIVDDTAGYQYVVSRTYPVEAGKLYDLSYFVKSDVYPAAKASVFLNFRDSDVQWVVNSPTVALSVTHANQWQQAKGEIRIPENVHFAQAFVFIHLQNAEQDSQIWFDDFSLVKQPYVPHLTRNLTDNKVTDANISGTNGWALSTSNLYDATQSRHTDGSGSFKLTNAYIDTTEGYDYVVSRMYPVEVDKLYTLSAFIKSDNFPGAAAGMFINFRDADGQWVENSPSNMQSVSNINEWQEVVSQFRVPDGAVFAQIYAFITRQHTESNSAVWFDDFYIGEGVSYEKAPSEKTPFNGNQTRIDRLGNVEIKRDGQWQPFIPLCIHADNLRPDWTIYSTQGFNCNMWAGSHLYI